MNSVNWIPCTTAGASIRFRKKSIVSPSPLYVTHEPALVLGVTKKHTTLLRAASKRLVERFRKRPASAGKNGDVSDFEEWFRRVSESLESDVELIEHAQVEP
ncbi:MAG: hypothetical protein AAF517_20700, partial [Planctomycetota bacterium]